jgi:adenylate cyclase
MKYQALDRIFNKPSFPHKFQCLQLDEHFHILDISEQVQRFADRPEEVMLGKDIRLSFPEFIGLEDILKSILQGEQDLFELEGIGRCYENRADIYMNLYIIGEKDNNTSASRLIILLEDITETMALKQKLAQRANEANLLLTSLMAYKKYMDQVINTMADALLITNNSGKIKKVNFAAQKLFGYHEKELIDQSISLIIDDYELIENILTKDIRLQTNHPNIEVVCHNKKREKLLVSFSFSRLKRGIKGLEDIIYIGRDITTRQRREQRIYAQYVITQILSESQSIKQAIPRILQAICQTLGWDVGELWTPNQYITIPVELDIADVVLRCVEIWSSRVVSVREFKAITWQTTYHSGVGLPGRIWARRSPYWIKDIADDHDFKRSKAAVAVGLQAAFGFPILDENQILGVMIFFSREAQPKDVELLQMMLSIGSQIAQFIKRKQTEISLRESEEEYRDLFENTNDLIQAVNVYGRFLYVNQSWKKTLGYSEAEIANMNVLEIVHPDFRPSTRQQLYAVMSGEKLEQISTALITKDGQTVFLEGNINCKFVEGKAVVIRGIFRNITRRLAAEAALRHQQEQTQNHSQNILPVIISKHPQQNPGNRKVDLVDFTVLLADIVGFDQIAASMSSMQLLNLLNPLFLAFDRLKEKYGLKQIKTVDDAYVVVAGLATQRPDHAQAIAHMALDMQTAIAIFNAENQQNFHIRIGIHSSSLVSATTELQDFTSDSWQNILNIARCVASQSFPGQIQVTQDTYKHLHKKFLLEKRLTITVNSQDKINTYLCMIRKSPN